jgi:hypothetical protein
LRSLPVSSSAGFNSTPMLVPSHPSVLESVCSDIVVDSGSIRAGDICLLMSDAAAAWYLALWESDRTALEKADLLLKASMEDELVNFFRGERCAKRIKNDDIAILRLEVSEKATIRGR